MKPLIVCAFVAFTSVILAVSSEDFSKSENLEAEDGKQNPTDGNSNRRRFLVSDTGIETKGNDSLGSSSVDHNDYANVGAEEPGRAFGITLPGNDGSVTVPFCRIKFPSNKTLPKGFDWRNERLNTPAKDQGTCAASYAFAVVGAIEAQIKKVANHIYELSEQSVIDCTYRKCVNKTYNEGCCGGKIGLVFKFFNETTAVRGKGYPFTSAENKKHGECRSDTVPKRHYVRFNLNYTRVINLTEEDLMRLLMEKGPLVVTLTLDREGRKYFRSLITDGEVPNELREESPSTVDHSAVLYGFRIEKKQKYWVVKNSWGRGWGDNGYGRIPRDGNKYNILSNGVWFVEVVNWKGLL